MNPTSKTPAHTVAALLLIFTLTSLFSAASDRALDLGNNSPHVIVILDSGASMTHDMETNSLNFLAAGDDVGFFTDFMETYYDSAYLESLLGPDYQTDLDRGSKLTQTKRALQTFFNAGYDFNYAFSYYEKTGISIGYLNFIYEVKTMIDTDDDEIPDTPQGPMLDGTLPGEPMRFGSREDMRNASPADPVFPVRFGANGDEIFIANDDPMGANTGTPSSPDPDDLRLVSFLVDSRDIPTAQPLYLLDATERRTALMYYYPAFFWGTPGVSDGLSWDRWVQEGLEGGRTWEEVAIFNGIDTADPGWRLIVNNYVLEDIFMVGDPWGLPLGTLTESNQIGSQTLYIREQFEIYVAGPGWTATDPISCPTCPDPLITEVGYVQHFVLYDHEPYELPPGSNTLSAVDWLGVGDCMGYLGEDGVGTPIVPLSQPDPLTGATSDQSSMIDSYLEPQTTPVFYFPHHTPFYMPELRTAYIPYTETVAAAGRRPLKDSISEAKTYFGFTVDNWPEPNSVCRAKFVVIVTDGTETCSALSAPCALAASIDAPVYLVYLGTADDLQAPDLQYLQCVPSESGGLYFEAGNESELNAALLAIGQEIEYLADPAPDFMIDPPSPLITDSITLDGFASYCKGGENALFDWSITGATVYDGCDDWMICTVPADTLNPGLHTITLTLTNQDTLDQWVIPKAMTVGGGGLIFADGFESGDTSVWSYSE